MKTRTLVARIFPILVLAGLACSPSLVSGQSAAPADVSATDFCDNVTEIPESECQALLDFYDSTNGPSWTDNSGWLVTDTPCGTPWRGVVCDDGHVAVLMLYSNNLSGSLPASLSGLPSLASLNLRDNQLTGGIPDGLGSLSDLSELNLSTNNMSGAIPASLGNLSGLAFLHLSRNQLTGSIPESLGNLPSLTYLNLSGNQLTGGVPDSLGNLSSLQYLLVNQNPLSGALPATLTALSLKTFYFDNTNLCEPPDAAFQAWLASIGFLQRTRVLCASDVTPTPTQTLTPTPTNTPMPTSTPSPERDERAYLPIVMHR